jgi:hypothetical protein
MRTLAVLAVLLWFPTDAFSDAERQCTRAKVRAVTEYVRLLRLLCRRGGGRRRARLRVPHCRHRRRPDARGRGGLTRSLPRHARRGWKRHLRAVPRGRSSGLPGRQAQRGRLEVQPPACVPRRRAATWRGATPRLLRPDREPLRATDRACRLARHLRRQRGPAGSDRRSLRAPHGHRALVRQRQARLRRDLRGRVRVLRLPARSSVARAASLPLGASSSAVRSRTASSVAGSMSSPASVRRLAASPTSRSRRRPSAASRRGRPVPMPSPPAQPSSARRLARAPPAGSRWSAPAAPTDAASPRAPRP